MAADSYLSIASILAGFGVTVLMFRIQRELDVREKFPECPNWLAWADYLVFATILLSLVFVVLPLAMLGESKRVLALAAGSSGAAATLMAAYPFAILAHYRIELGTRRSGYREKGEPIEKVIVIGVAVIATGVFGGTIAVRLCAL